MDPGRLIAVQLVRFVAATQATMALVLHGIWMLLVIATWQASDPTGEVAAMTRPLMRAFAWLGGFERGGHGDEGHVAQAMALLAVPFYLLASLRRRRADGPSPLLAGLLKWAAVSGVVATAGFARAFWSGGLTGLDLVFLATLMGVLTAGATAWAVVTHRVGEILVDRLGSR